MSKQFGGCGFLPLGPLDQEPQVSSSRPAGAREPASEGEARGAKAMPQPRLPPEPCSQAGLEELWVVWALHTIYMVVLLVLVFGSLGSARDESHAHLGRGGALSWALRVREASSMARSSVAAGVAAGEEGSGARSMTLSPYRFNDSSTWR